MTLSTYRKKRDFRKTLEPAGGRARRRSGKTGLRFTIQKHDASRLHYDLRLEMEGVLRSWAVPKGPSLNPAEKRLAVEVEDHPIEYGSFEGTIPQGEYGGGTVLLWDQGTWEPLGAKDAVAAYRAGKIKFAMEGSKLHGHWTLVRMHASAPGLKSNWLLIKEQDEHATSDPRKDITAIAPLSVVSGKDLPAIASGESAVWTGRGAVEPKAAPRKAKGSLREAKAATGEPARPRRGQHKSRSASDSMTGHTAARATKRAGARSADIEFPASAMAGPMPSSLAPQLCTLVEEVPRGHEWRHEVKFDGYRILAFLNGTRAKTLTRAGHDWSAKFPELVEALSRIKAESAILDGELVSLDERGLSHFQGLQASLKKGATDRLVYFVFDLLYLDGMDLRRCTLDERHEILSRLIGRSAFNGPAGRIRLSEHIDGSGEQIMEHACRLNLEGIVSKRADSVYSSARSPAWVKIKCGDRQEFVVAGYTDPKNSRAGFGALVLGYYNADGELMHAGRVGSGFDDALLRDLREELRTLETPKSPFAKPLTGAAARGVHWVRPKMVAEVAFTQWTGDGLLRHPVFAGVRADKKARDVVREEPAPTPRGGVKAAATSRPPAGGSSIKKPRATEGRANKPRPAGESSQVLGVEISHPERVVYPESGITKLDVARYYEAVAEVLMPQVADRPLSLVRCPGGVGGSCFFNKHLETKALAGLREIPIQESMGTRMYVVVTEPAGLISLAQMNTLELHAWGSTASDLERPDRLVFDLDPGENVEWKEMVLGARRTRKLLEQLGLESFVRTTGGKGLHVVAPIRPTEDWETVKTFCRRFAEFMQSQWPEEYIATMSKAKRRDKIFVDYLRNQRGATAIVTFSTRARAGAGVSMPLSWEQLARGKPGSHTISSVPPLLTGRWRDPWKGFDALEQSLPKET